MNFVPNITRTEVDKTKNEVVSKLIGYLVCFITAADRGRVNYYFIKIWN